MLRVILLLVALFCRIDATDYDVKFFLTSDFAGSSDLTVLCGQNSVVNIPIAGGSHPRVLSRKVRCTDVAAGGVVFQKDSATKITKLPVTGGTWMGYWEGVIIDISEVASPQGTDCLANRFDVTKLGETSFGYDIAVVDSSEACGSLGRYSNIDGRAPVFAYEKELTDCNGVAIEDDKLSCFSERTDGCCRKEKPEPSGYIFRVRIYDNVGYEGLMACVGGDDRSCEYGLHKDGLAFPYVFWRSIDFSIPEEVVLQRTESSVTLINPLSLALYGRRVVGTEGSGAIRYQFKPIMDFYLGGVTYEFDKSVFFPGDINMFGFVSKEGSGSDNYTSSTGMEYVLRVESLPPGEGFVELFFLDGSVRRREVISYQELDKGFPIMLHDFLKTTDEIQFFFKINGEKRYGLFKLKNDGSQPVIYVHSDESLKVGTKFEFTRKGYVSLQS